MSEQVLADHPEIRAIKVGKRQRTLYVFDLNGTCRQHYDLRKLVEALQKVKRGESCAGTGVFNRPESRIN